MNSKLTSSNINLTTFSFMGTMNLQVPKDMIQFQRLRIESEKVTFCGIYILQWNITQP